MPIPWHLQREPFRERSRIPEMILEGGRINAEAIRRQGDIWANAVSGAGAAIGEGIRSSAAAKAQREAEAARTAREESHYREQTGLAKERLEIERKESERRARQEEEERKRREEEERKKREREGKIQGAATQTASRQKVLESLQGDPEGYAQATKHFKEIDDNLKRTLGSWAAAVRSAGDDPRYATMALADMVENGFDPKHLAPYAQRMGTKEGVTSVIDTLLRGSPDEGHQRLATPVDKTPAAVGSPEDYTLRYAREVGKDPSQLTTADVERAKAKYAAAGREPDKPKEPIKIEVFNDQTGEMETRFITPEDARAMARGEKPAISKGPSTAERNRMGAARTSIERGESLLAELKDPKFSEKLGAVIGRYNSLAAAAGAGDPDAQYIVGEIKSFSALQPQIHGFRAVQMAQDVEKLLSTKQDPKALAGALKGILTASYSVAKKPQPGETGGPKVGTVEGGYRFKGGNPADKSNWEKVQ